MQTTYVLASAIIGALIAIQALVNARLATYTSSFMWTAVVSFLVGLVALVALAFGTRAPLPTLAMVSPAPWWAWIGGLFGATYIATLVVLIPRMSPSVLFGAAIAGQMTMLVIAEHFEIAGAARHSMNMTRLIGVALIVAGTALCKR
jgi:transporter family-2 protein